MVPTGYHEEEILGKAYDARLMRRLLTYVRPYKAWVAGSVANMSGMPDGFSDITHTITIGPTRSASAGREICLDSSYFPPSGSWLWAPGGKPTWSGPHCYRIQ